MLVINGMIREGYRWLGFVNGTTFHSVLARAYHSIHKEMLGRVLEFTNRCDFNGNLDYFAPELDVETGDLIVLSHYKGYRCFEFLTDEYFLVVEYVS